MRPTCKLQSTPSTREPYLQLERGGGSTATSQLEPRRNLQSILIDISNPQESHYCPRNLCSGGGKDAPRFKSELFKYIFTNAGKAVNNWLGHFYIR